MAVVGALALLFLVLIAAAFVVSVTADRVKAQSRLASFDCAETASP